MASKPYLVLTRVLSVSTDGDSPVVFTPASTAYDMVRHSLHCPRNRIVVLAESEGRTIHNVEYLASVDFASSKQLAEVRVVLCKDCLFVGHPDMHSPREVDRLLDRVAPGDPMPAGQCPTCGGLLYPPTVKSA